MISTHVDPGTQLVVIRRKRADGHEDFIYLSFTEVCGASHVLRDYAESIKPADLEEGFEEPRVYRVEDGNR